MLNIYVIIHLFVPPPRSQLQGGMHLTYHFSLIVQTELYAWELCITSLLSEWMSENKSIHQIQLREVCSPVEGEREGALLIWPHRDLGFQLTVSVWDPSFQALYCWVGMISCRDIFSPIKWSVLEDSSALLVFIAPTALGSTFGEGWCVWRDDRGPDQDDLSFPEATYVNL